MKLIKQLPEISNKSIILGILEYSLQLKYQETLRSIPHQAHTCNDTFSYLAQVIFFESFLSHRPNNDMTFIFTLDPKR